MSRISERLRSHDLPTLSLAMIVKDEADTLERCLSSARPYVDEIVVVDTGSTDGSRDIARRYADVFDEIEWPDSFAKARNHSFDLASCDYVMYLDGDEYLPEASHWRRLRRELGKPDVAALQIRIRNLLSKNKILEADCFWQERVMRNEPDMRFTGRVHNQIHESLNRHLEATGERLVRVDAEVVHSGYALPKVEKKEKYRKRLHLLHAEYESPRSEGYRAYYGFQLGVAYSILENYDKAMELFGELNYDLLTDENAYYAHLLAAVGSMHQENPPMALVHTERMLTIDPEEPIGYYLSGFALLKAGHVGDGLLMLIRAFEVSEERQASVRFVLSLRKLMEGLSQASQALGMEKYARQFEALTRKEEHDRQLTKQLVSYLLQDVVRAENQAA